MTIAAEAADAGYFYYFGFGSNLLLERIRLMNPTAEFVGTGQLRDYALGFGGYAKRWRGAGATVFHTLGESVFGCVWRLADADSDHLDRQERAYHRLQVDVRLLHSDRLVHCRSYQMTDVTSGDHRPSPHYKHVIVCGAVEHALPDAYVEQLRRIPDNGYKGRVNFDFSVLAELNAVQELS